MATADGSRPGGDAIELSLDEVREFLYVGLRAQERSSVNLKALVEALDGRKEYEEWLEQAQDEAEKGLVFHEQQAAAWAGFKARVDAYVEAVRADAEELAIKGVCVKSATSSRPRPMHGAKHRTCAQAQNVHARLVFC